MSAHDSGAGLVLRLTSGAALCTHVSDDERPLTTVHTGYIGRGRLGMRVLPSFPLPVAIISLLGGRSA